MPRPTITDVARAAGVSKGAVSFALNDRPGLAPETRQRILDVAAELGWTPSPRARALSVSKALAVGLVVARPPEIFRADAFFPSFISGLEMVLSERGHALLLMVAEHGDVAIYRRLAREGRVDGVFVTDLQVDDPRPALLEELGLPAVVIGPRAEATPPRRSASTTLRASRPRSSTSSVSGTGASRTSPARSRWCTAGPAVRPGSGRCGEAGLPADLCVEADFSAESGATATRELLDLAEPPTAIVYANDLMAMAGLSLAVSRGVSVPGRAVGHRVRRHRDRRAPAAVADHGQHRRRRLGPGRGDPAARADRLPGAHPRRPAAGPARRARLDRTRARPPT